MTILIGGSKILLWVPHKKSFKEIGIVKRTKKRIRSQLTMQL